MIKHVWTVLCDRISTDHTGAFSYLASFDKLITAGVPAVMTRLSISIKWFNEDAKERTVKFKIELLRPDGNKEVLGPEMNATIKPMGSYRANIVLDGMPIPLFGMYKFFVIRMDKKKESVVAEIPLPVAKAETSDEKR